ncbi:MAG: hypothetical protein K0R57_2308 [Paenibacillaceae bacterium]|nr:hypothetical protein [Paenibacillaceae bacterium]
MYLAEDGRIPGKLWAVKEVNPGAAQREAFVNEARLLAECSHPGLASIADFLAPDHTGACYLVMEYIHGETLLQLFHRQQPFGWQLALRIAIELCDVLAYLHEGRPAPIIHRDLKPSNVMLDEGGRVRLIDFGTARHYSGTTNADTVQLGTVGFAAPELLLGKQTDARADVYTLGAMLYFLLSEGCYWSRDNARKAGLPEEIPGAFRQIIFRMLEEEPSRRYQRAEEAKLALRECLAADGKIQLGPSQHTASISEHSGRQRIVVGSLIAGAGASFVAMGLARVLNRHKVEHVLAELPGARPDLYHALFGEQNAPSGYVYPSGMVFGGKVAAQAYKPWKNGRTEWAPLPPGYQGENWEEEQTERLLERYTQPVAILDVGTGWFCPHTLALCHTATLILLVCGPSPVHLSRNEAVSVWTMLNGLKQSGIEVGLVANRSANFGGKEEWIRALPLHPACHIPEFPSELVLSALWRGELAAEHPAVLPALATALELVVQKICGSLIGPSRAEDTSWRRLKGAFSKKR